MTNASPAPATPNPAPYGYCPVCSCPGVNTERRPDGNTTCRNGHTSRRSRFTDSPAVAP